MTAQSSVTKNVMVSDFSDWKLETSYCCMCLKTDMRQVIRNIACYLLSHKASQMSLALNLYLGDDIWKVVSKINDIIFIFLHLLELFPPGLVMGFPVFEDSSPSFFLSSFFQAALAMSRAKFTLSKVLVASRNLSSIPSAWWYGCTSEHKLESIPGSWMPPLPLLSDSWSWQESIWCRWADVLPQAHHKWDLAWGCSVLKSSCPQHHTHWQSSTLLKLPWRATSSWGFVLTLPIEIACCRSFSVDEIQT